MKQSEIFRLADGQDWLDGEVPPGSDGNYEGLHADREQEKRNVYRVDP